MRVSRRSDRGTPFKNGLEYTREEDIDYGTINDIKFLLEEVLIQKSARYNKVQPWA